MAVGATVLKADQKMYSTTNPNVTIEPVLKAKPVLVSNSQVKLRTRVKGSHLFLIAFLSLMVAAQLIVVRAKITDLHYQIQVLNYQTDQVINERDAHYQHQAELSKLSRLKEVVTAQGAILDSSKVFRLPEQPISSNEG